MRDPETPVRDGAIQGKTSQSRGSRTTDVGVVRLGSWKRCSGVETGTRTHPVHPSYKRWRRIDLTRYTRRCGWRYQFFRRDSGDEVRNTFARNPGPRAHAEKAIRQSGLEGEDRLSRFTNCWLRNEPIFLQVDSIRGPESFIEHRAARTRTV